MDYSLIKSIAKEKEISLETLANNAGITSAGFHKYVRLNTMPLKILENICDQLNISLLQVVANDRELITQIDKENYDLLKENRELRIRISELEKKISNFQESKVK